MNLARGSHEVLIRIEKTSRRSRRRIRLWLVAPIAQHAPALATMQRRLRVERKKLKKVRAMLGAMLDG